MLKNYGMNIIQISYIFSFLFTQWYVKELRYMNVIQISYSFLLETPKIRDPHVWLCQNIKVKLLKMNTKSSLPLFVFRFQVWLCWSLPLFSILSMTVVKSLCLFLFFDMLLSRRVCTQKKKKNEYVKPFSLETQCCVITPIRAHISWNESCKL